MRWLAVIAALCTAARADSGDADKARRALAVIDGRPATAHGELVGAAQLSSGDGYVVERPQRAFGAPYVIAYLKSTIAEVRALYPGVPALPIYDLSAEHGGKISDHVSHRTGLDVDVGYYAQHGQLDLEATWALVVAFARTADRPDGVEMIFLDYELQRRLYNWARARGTPDSALAFVLQYPRGPHELAGLVRHWPNHTDHLHVRFKAR
ncbi:MAG TPA: penicillin-insensitive murein endopeptidase [Kofleriaceae bacterium]|jgi:murein endopeptidase|nr:penicillin-insensitive murein endopeptidase [Kofleriaceae bacterium]